MRLTTKGRFAVTALLDLAMQHSNNPVTLADISQRQKFPFLIWNNYLPNYVNVNWLIVFVDQEVGIV